MRRVVYTGGTFDLFHPGHVNFLRTCKHIAGESDVIVSLNTDEFVKEYKGFYPTMNFEARREMLHSCRYVDCVIENTGGANSKPAILSVNPNFIVIGSDWATKDYYAQMSFTQKWLDSHGITLIYVANPGDISTTKIKESIINGNL